jgi:hypothetical protein
MFFEGIRSEREQFARANEERHDWLARGGAPDRTIIRASYRRRSDFEASTTSAVSTSLGWPQNRDGARRLSTTRATII